MFEAAPAPSIEAKRGSYLQVPPPLVAWRQRPEKTTYKEVRSHCPVTYGLEIFGDRWSLLIVRDIGKGAVTTIEAVGQTPKAKALPQAWVELEVPHCGSCQSGQIMSAAALLAQTPKPTDADIDAAMSGNVCRCGTYQRIRAAIHRAAG
jgi:[2Fe-2S] binding domain